MLTFSRLHSYISRKNAAYGLGYIFCPWPGSFVIEPYIYPDGPVSESILRYII